VRSNFYVGGARPIAFTGDLHPAAIAVDMRMYYARLLEDFAVRGGRVVIGTLQAGDVERLAGQHDLMVLASGRGSLATMFPRLVAHSPYSTPQRLGVGGLYRGVSHSQPLEIDVVIAPGHGEFLVTPFYSFEPQLTAIYIQIVHGGAFEVLRRVRYRDDPRGFDAAVLGLLRDYAPATYARIDPSHFELVRPRDLVHAAITPTVRRGYVQMRNGRFAVALGDAHVLLDPITAQGANTASHAAWVLGEAIRDSASFDEAFCKRVEQQILTYAGPVAEACNARLRPPAAHVAELLVAAARHKAIANAYADGFNQPDAFWNMLSSPERTTAFLKQYGWPDIPAAARAA
jgi:2-polyprenyl-6-methoxyphenol hydroxylase-like FAD-dependent oxidoreductase